MEEVAIRIRGEGLFDTSSYEQKRETFASLDAYLLMSMELSYVDNISFSFPPRSQTYL